MENVKGCYLQDILEEHKLYSIFVERGKVMVMSVNGVRYIFENEKDFIYKDNYNSLMEAVPGSVINVDTGAALHNKDYMLAQYVRFPTDTELEWYEKQDTV